ncbi:MAG: transglycosylase SLT domain-containing protein [Lentisphaeria bacterium]|nr:transglycosylase SLT domain-containing protein [Lentisphaeria bacterium]
MSKSLILTAVLLLFLSLAYAAVSRKNMMRQIHFSEMITEREMGVCPEKINETKINVAKKPQAVPLQAKQSVFDFALEIYGIHLEKYPWMKPYYHMDSLFAANAGRSENKNRMNEKSVGLGSFQYPGIPSIACYDELIRNAGLKYHIDPALIKAVIWRESRFNHDARGIKGEIGLMQLMPGTHYAAADWARFHNRKIPSKHALRDPELNIDIGSWYLSRALRRYKKYKDAAALALCEYNAGARRTAGWKPARLNDPVARRITLLSTRHYVKTVLKRYEYYKNLESLKTQKGR